MNTATATLPVASNPTTLGIGDTIVVNGMRMHRYTSCVRVTDLTYAGKRGKRCPQFAVYDMDYVRSDAEQDKVNEFVAALPTARGYAHAAIMAQTLVNSSTYAKIEVRELRGVDVKPAGFRMIQISTEHVLLEADSDRFSIRDLKDRNNEPTAIPGRHHRKSDVLAFYRWVEGNVAQIEQMTYRQILRAMGDQQIEYHDYCAVD